MSEWLAAGFAHAQADPRVGMRFPVLFSQAGLEDVGSLGVQAYWAPENPEGPSYEVGVVRAMKDAIVASGAATEEEMGLDTLAQRFGEAVRAANAV
jgi:hypothetical protein